MLKNEEVKEAMIQGINRFLFCGWNFETTLCKVRMNGDVCHVTVPRVIAEAKWNCNVEHMVWSSPTVLTGKMAIQKMKSICWPVK